MAYYLSDADCLGSVAGCVRGRLFREWTSGLWEHCQVVRVDGFPSGGVPRRRCAVCRICSAAFTRLGIVLFGTRSVSVALFHL